MSGIIDGFKNQVWRVLEMDGLQPTWEKRIPLSDASEAEIIALLEGYAKEQLTPREIESSPSLFQASRDSGRGNRMIITAGQNPHYVASLWRADELAERDASL